MKEEIYDVIIVGGGPAGSTAAYYLAKNKKIKILIVDRCDFPRHKSCAGILNHLEELKSLENYVKIKGKLKFQPSKSIKFYWDTKDAFSRKYKSLFNQVDRTEFDNLLLKEALKNPNVSFKKFGVERIKEKGGEFILHSGKNQIKGKYLVGADGWCSTVSRFLGNNKRDKMEYALCVEHDIICDKKDLSSHIFYFYAKEMGYAWVTPTRKGYYCGLGMVGDTKKNVTAYLKDFLNHCKKINLIPKKHTIKRTFGAPDPTTIQKNYAAEKILLCGDALGTVKQPTGEGIYYSMLSGKIVGETIGESTDNLRRRYKKAIKPVIKSVTSFRKIPPKLFVLTIFNIFSKILVSKKLPKNLRGMLQNYFVEKLLDFK